MTLRDAKRLYDIAIRLQVYIEGVKANQGAEFHDVLFNVDTEFRKLLGRVKYDTLDGLSKAELNRLIISLRQSQSKVYSAYVNKVIKQLQDFMQACLTVNRVVFTSAFLPLGDDDEPEILSDEKASALIEQESERNNLVPIFGLAAILIGSDKLWSRISNEPLAANGAMLLPFLKSFSASAQLSIENLIRKGYSNGWTAAQTQREMTAQLNKIANQADAVLSTAMQHVSSAVGVGVQSSLWGKYRWVSVIDGGTTEICLSRNGKVYRYGEGPVPPAHIRCRSTTIPYNAAHDDETFYAWIKRQPERTQNFALGKKVADLLRSGKVKAKDLIRLANPTPITITQFKKAGIEIITG